MGGFMKAYKLLKQRRDGSLGPLFINVKQKIPIGDWLESECHPTKGYAVRPGWHCTAKPKAPHLAKKPKSGQIRVWCEVEINDITPFQRPKSQGGLWYLAKYMRIIRIIG